MQAPKRIKIVAPEWDTFVLEKLASLLTDREFCSFMVVSRDCYEAMRSIRENRVQKLWRMSLETPACVALFYRLARDNVISKAKFRSILKQHNLNGEKLSLMQHGYIRQYVYEDNATDPGVDYALHCYSPLGHAYNTLLPYKTMRWAVPWRMPTEDVAAMAVRIVQNRPLQKERVLYLLRESNYPESLLAKVEDALKDGGVRV